MKLPLTIRNKRLKLNPVPGIGQVSIYRVIQSSSAILKEAVEEITWNRICKVLQILHRFLVATFYAGVEFISMIDNFYKMETIRFNKICQLSYLVSIEEINSVLRSIFQSLLLSTPF
jgi:hypothetical protein